MGSLPDAPSVVLAAITLAAILFLVEVALPTFGVAGLSALALVVLGYAVAAEQDHPWWPLLLAAAGVCLWAVLLFARRTSTWGQNPAASVVKIRDWYSSSQLVAQTTLRSTVGRHELDQLLSERDRIDAELQAALDSQTEPWGVKVHRVEIRDVGLPEQMQRAMARQAEAERERRAKIIAAEGELQASQKLGEAAQVIAASPGALQLRQLQTMAEISAENNSTIIFPIPIEMLEAFQAVSRMGVVPTPAAPPR